MNILTYFWLKFVLIFKVDFSWSKSSHFQESWKMDRKFCNFFSFLALGMQIIFISCIGNANFLYFLSWQHKVFNFFALAMQIFKIFCSKSIHFPTFFKVARLTSRKNQLWKSKQISAISAISVALQKPDGSD